MTRKRRIAASRPSFAPPRGGRLKDPALRVAHSLQTSTIRHPPPPSPAGPARPGAARQGGLAARFAARRRKEGVAMVFIISEGEDPYGVPGGQAPSPLRVHPKGVITIGAELIRSQLRCQDVSLREGNLPQIAMRDLHRLTAPAPHTTTRCQLCLLKNLVSARARVLTRARERSRARGARE